jgi:hypothetical protein
VALGGAVSKKYNPIYAAAWGIAAGFILFAVTVIRSGTWWPSPAVSELGLKILVLTSALFAITAVVKNRLIERNLEEEQARRVSKYRRMYTSM